MIFLSINQFNCNSLSLSVKVFGLIVQSAFLMLLKLLFQIITWYKIWRVHILESSQKSLFTLQVGFILIIFY